MKNITNIHQDTTPLSGSPRVNRLFLATVPTAGDYITLTADGVSDIYEFRADSPPTGGTAGRIWLYKGASANESRDILSTAIRGVTDPRVVRTANNPTAGTNQLNLYSIQSDTSSVIVVEWTQIPGDATAGQPEVHPTVISLTATENLTNANSIWDQLNFYGTPAVSAGKMSVMALTLNAATIAKGSLEMVMAFTPTNVLITNLMRPQAEAVSLTGNIVRLVLAGGAAPNNQPNDVLNVVVFG